MKLRGLIYKILFRAAMQFVEPKLKAGLPVAFEVLDGQMARAIINGDPGLVSKGLDVAVRLATGGEESTPEQIQQLSALFDPLIFVAGMTARNQASYPQPPAL